MQHGTERGRENLKMTPLHAYHTIHLSKSLKICKAQDSIFTACIPLKTDRVAATTVEKVLKWFYSDNMHEAVDPAYGWLPGAWLSGDDR